MRTFKNIVVHPTQEMRYPDGAYYRGGPEWPHFETQILARHCWGFLPRPFDSRPLPAEPEWPHFDLRLYTEPGFLPRRFGRAAARPTGDRSIDSVDRGIWCGPITDHFGHMIADFGMRIAASSRLDEAIPLVFGIWPLRDFEPPRFFWEIIAHFSIARSRVLLVRRPLQFGELSVLPQAERRFGGGPSRRHLRLMDEITGTPDGRDRERGWLFVSRSRLPEGRFAGESYLEEVLEAAGIRVFHPEKVDLAAQLELYRRADRLIFSEGSALHALQLLGHLASDIVVLARRPRSRLAAASLRPRARSLHYIAAARGVVHGLFPNGHPRPATGISPLNEERLLAGLAALGISLGALWDRRAYAARAEADIEDWLARRRSAAAVHPQEDRTIEQRLQAFAPGAATAARTQ